MRCQYWLVDIIWMFALDYQLMNQRVALSLVGYCYFFKVQSLFSYSFLLFLTSIIFIISLLFSLNLRHAHITHIQFSLLSLLCTQRFSISAVDNKLLSRFWAHSSCMDRILCGDCHFCAFIWQTWLSEYHDLLFEKVDYQVLWRHPNVELCLAVDMQCGTQRRVFCRWRNKILNHLLAYRR